MTKIRTVELPTDERRSAPLSARRATVGDRLHVQCADINNETVTVVVVAEQVDRLHCGCDRIYTARPGGQFPEDRMQLLPLGCYHDPVDSDDYDVARLAAISAISTGDAE